MGSSGAVDRTVDGEPGAAGAKSQPHGDTPTMSVVGMGWSVGRGPGHMSTEMLWAGWIGGRRPAVGDLVTPKWALEADCAAGGKLEPKRLRTDVAPGEIKP